MAAAIRWLLFVGAIPCAWASPAKDAATLRHEYWQRETARLERQDHRRQSGLPPGGTPARVPISGSWSDDSGRVFSWSGWLEIESITVTQITPPPPPLTLAYCSVSPAVVTGGQPATFLIVLSRQADALTPVRIESTGAEAAFGASHAMVQPGEEIVRVPVATQPVTARRLVGLWASLSGKSAGANLTLEPGLTPPPPPPPGGPPLIRGYRDAAGRLLGDLPGRAGQAVTILGDNFGPVAGAVEFERRSCPVLSWSASAVQFRLPGPEFVRPAGAQRGTVLLTRADGQQCESLGFVLAP